MEQNLDETLKENSGGSISTRSVGIRYGLIMGAVGIAYFVALNIAGVDMTQGPWRWCSYLYIFAILYFAHKYFKDSGNGYMSYGEGMGISFWTGLVSSILSSVFTFIYLKFIDASMIQTAMDNARAEMEKGGKMSDAQIDQAMGYTSMFMTPGAFLILGVIFGLIGILIAGLIVSAFTQKKNPTTIYN